MSDVYVKKPIPVTAVQWFPGVEHPAVSQQMDECGNVQYFVSTLENQHLYLTPGCWIVGAGAAGEYWPVDEHIFAATYEMYSEKST